METTDSWSAIMGLLQAGPLDGEEYPSELARRSDQVAMVAAMKAIFAVLSAMSPEALRDWLNYGWVTAHPGAYSFETAEQFRAAIAYRLHELPEEGEALEREKAQAIYNLCSNFLPSRLDEAQFRANLSRMQNLLPCCRVSR